MEYKSVKGYGGWGQLGFLTLFFGGGLVLTALIQLLILLFMKSPGALATDEEGLMKIMLAPENLDLARLSQFFGTLCLLFLPAWLWSRVVNGRSIIWLGFSKHFSAAQVLLGFAIIFAAAIAAGPVANLSKSIAANFPRLDLWAKNLEDNYNLQVTALSNLRSWPEYFMALVVMAFLPAIFEETFFRGAMQNLLVKWWKQPLIAILFTSLVFSLVHLSVYLFLSRLFLGVVLGYMYHETKNIWVNIIAHFLNNAIAVTALFVMHLQGKTAGPEDLEPGFHWSISLAAVAVTFFLFKLLQQYSAGKREKIIGKEQLLSAEQDPFHSFAQPEKQERWD